MCCYIVPAIAAMLHFFMRRKIPTMNTKEHLWLNMLFSGGAIFGVVDHLWNGELFLLGPNLMWDLALGVTITLTIIAAWKVMVWQSKVSVENKISS